MFSLQNSQMQPQVPNNQQTTQNAPQQAAPAGSIHKHPNTINNTLHSPEQGDTDAPVAHPSPPEEAPADKTEGRNNKETQGWSLAPVKSKLAREYTPLSLPVDKSSKGRDSKGGRTEKEGW